MMLGGHHALQRRLCLVPRGVQQLPRVASRQISTLKRSDKSTSAQGGEGRSRESSAALPKTPCRTRFAPSPTGYLHLGSLRTALYNYLLAKATNGQFLLRLEDTDQGRLVSDAEQRLYHDLKWAGLTWDEGPDVGGPYGPYRQSERLALYDKHSDRLVEEGKAYRCFCPPDELAAHRLSHKDHNSPPPPNPCVHISAEESAERAAKGERHCVVFKASPEPTEIQDLVYGSFMSKHPENDFILRKTDGFPTYHFANVVDDHAMKITHVVRGAEWLVSTPKHVELYKALQWEPPAFAHVGLLVDPNRQKLSKRALGADLSSYRQERIIPAALLNFAALLGWSPGAVEDEVLTLEDMVQKFRLRFTKGDIMVKLPGKLTHFDSAHKRRLLEQEPPNMPLLQEYVFAELEEGLGDYLYEQEEAYQQVTGKTGKPQMTPLAAAAYSTEAGKMVQPAFFLDLLRLGTASKSKRPQDAASRRHLICHIPEPYLVHTLRGRRLLDAVLGTKSAKAETSPHPHAARACELISGALEAVRERLEGLPQERWTEEALGDVLSETEPRLGELLGSQFEQAGVEPEMVEKKVRIATSEILRWALVASDPAAPNKTVMGFLGREEVLERLSTAAGMAKKAAEDPDWQPEGFEWMEVQVQGAGQGDGKEGRLTRR